MKTRRLRRLGLRGHRPGLRRRAGRDGRARPTGTIAAGDVVVIRYEGPKGGPGMREMLAITGAIKGAGLGKDVLLITDGRFSGGTTGPLRRPHRARGRRRRPDRVRPRRRPDHPRRRQPDRSRSTSTTDELGAAQGRLGAAAAEVHPRRARQVRQGRAVRRPRRRHQLTCSAKTLPDRRAHRSLDPRSAVTLALVADRAGGVGRRATPGGARPTASRRRGRAAPAPAPSAAAPTRAEPTATEPPAARARDAGATLPARRHAGSSATTASWSPTTAPPAPAPSACSARPTRTRCTSGCAGAAAPFRRPGEPVQPVYELIVTVADRDARARTATTATTSRATRCGATSARRTATTRCCCSTSSRAGPASSTVAKRWEWALRDP